MESTLPSAAPPASPAEFLCPTRPSPIVPSTTPAVSRPSSPSRLRLNSTGLQSSELLTALADDAAGQHIFERDVQFNPLHLLSPGDAIDVSVPSVLDEVALSDDAFGAEEFAEIVEGAHSGWSLESPHPNPVSTLSRSSSTALRARSNSPSPPRSPGSLVGGAGALSQQPRLASPGASSYSFSSIGTPSNSPPATPLNTDSRAKEAADLAADNPFASFISTTSTTPALGIPHPTLIPFPSSSALLTTDSDSLPPSPSEIFNPRRKSSFNFTSLADVINSERMSEMTGNPVGED